MQIYNGIVKYQTHDFSSHMIFGNKKDNKMCVPSIYREFNDLKWIKETCFNIMCISPFHSWLNAAHIVLVSF